MESELDFANYVKQGSVLSAKNRPIRMRLAHPARAFRDVLLPQRVSGTAAVCEGHTYEILCVATNPAIELKQLIALPVALDFVTDRGELNSICGIVTQASSGGSDGGIATYKLVMRDAVAIMEKRINTRIFREMNEFDIVRRLVNEWRQSNEVMANTFNLDVDEAFHLRDYPPREFTMQFNESDAAFIRRLLARRGIAWFIRSGRAGAGEGDSSVAAVPAHTLVLFNDSRSLQENAAGTVRYHRDHATEERDTITSWVGIRNLQSGSVARYSWDYKNPQGHFATAEFSGESDQGPNGNELAASLSDYQIQTPHAGDRHDDLRQLGRLRMNRHDYQTKCYRGETSVRDFKVCETFHLTGHPEIDSDPPEQRSFVITGMQVVAQNNLPKGVAQKVERLFDQHRWTRLPGMRGGDGVDADMDGTQVRFCSVISAVRIGVPIVPAYDEWADLPSVPMQSAIVVGPPGEEVHCDELGRVKIRFPGMRAVDHEHAHGAGASGTDADSAWVRVTSSWAGNGPGAQRQCGFIALPPVGSEVAVAFMGGDPDKPVIVGQLYNADGRPPALSDRGDLPGNRHLSGMKSRENKGSRHNQLRFDDSNGRINAQLASDHGTSQLNLGYLTQPLANGYGEDRGEGAELRSDKAVVLRGGHGVLVSAAGSQGARGKQLDRAEMIGLNDVLHSIYKTLCDLANTHLAGKADGEPLAKLIEHIRQWEGAQADGGKQVVAVSAPAGIAIASQANVAIGARTNVDVTSAGNIQMSTGRELLMRAAQGLSLFSHRLGMQLIAAAGKMSMQTHQDNMELTAAKQLVLTAKDEIILQAPKVTILTQGAQASYGGGAVTYQLTGAYTIKSASFAHRKPGDGSPAAINLPTSATSHDQRVCIRDLNTGRPKAHQRYRVTLEDGKAIEGTSDAKGMTEVLKSSIPFGRYKIEALDD